MLSETYVNSLLLLKCLKSFSFSHDVRYYCVCTRAPFQCPWPPDGTVRNEFVKDLTRINHGDE
jgi:hypothetical protein